MDAGWALVPGLITMMAAGLDVVRVVRWIAPAIRVKASDRKLESTFRKNPMLKHKAGPR